jgi:hypothetical protein
MYNAIHQARKKERELLPQPFIATTDKTLNSQIRIRNDCRREIGKTLKREAELRRERAKTEILSYTIAGTIRLSQRPASHIRMDHIWRIGVQPQYGHHSNDPYP